MCISLYRKLSDRLCDWVWPHVTGSQVAAPDCQDYFRIEQAGNLDDVSNILATRQSQVDERVRIVESKLVVLLTLTSVLSAAVAASLVAATTLGTVKEDFKPFAWVAVFLVFYVAVQILCSLWATVTALMRRSFKQLSAEDIVPLDSETRDAYRVRLLLEPDQPLGNSSGRARGLYCNECAVAARRRPLHCLADYSLR